MQPISLEKIEEIVNGRLYAKEKNIMVSHISKDTRTLRENDVYLGLKGEKFDGNLFYQEAFKKKCSLVILDCKEEDVDLSLGNFLFVENSLDALHKLASYERDLFSGPVVAVTGSVGKTSTRSLIATLLSEKYSVLSTEGNFNNDIGLPLTILEHANEEVMVLEMGMNHLGEIHKLSLLAKPTIGVITNVGTAHIGNLGSRENILKAKLEITDGMNDDGLLIINGENDLLGKVKDTSKIIKCYLNEKKGFYIEDIKRVKNNISFKLLNEEYTLNNSSYPMLMNCVLALAVAKKLDLSYEQITSGLKKYLGADNRMSIVKTKDYTIIDDTYNASVEAISSAIDFLKNYNNERKVVILGDILEVGEFAQEIHENIARIILNNPVDLVISCGPNAKYINSYLVKNNLNSIYYENIDDLINNLLSNLKENDTILIKASHGMNFKKIVTYLTML